jgi:hypothetical protein
MLPAIVQGNRISIIMDIGVMTESSCVDACVCVQVAGLDVGWHTLLDLQENPETKRLEVTREVLPGTYNFKFIVDGRWVANHDYPTYLV